MASDKVLTSFSILIVDDEAKNIQLLGRILEEKKYDIEFAMNGKECLEWLDRKSFDLVLLDVMMPKMSGYEATQMLKSQPETACITIVALTSHAMDDERERALKAGCDGYITKPIDTRVFPDQVRQYLDSQGNKTGKSGAQGETGTI